MSGPLVNHCSGKSIQKEIELRKRTIPTQIAKNGLSVFELLITVITIIPAKLCEPAAAKPPVPRVASLIQPATARESRILMAA